MKFHKLLIIPISLGLCVLAVPAQPTLNLGPFMGTIPAQSGQFTGGSRQTVDFGPFDIPGPGRITFEVFSTPNVRQEVENIERHDSTVQTIEFNGEEISLRPDYPICNDPGSDPAECVSIWDPPTAGVLNFELLGPATYNIFGEFSGHVAQNYTLNVYYQRGPIVSEVIPDTGSTEGWQTVSVMGSDFAENAVVLFGGVAATETVRISMNEIQCKVPPSVPGATDVIVLHPDPERARWNFGRPWGIFGVLPEGFTYESPLPPPVLQAERLLGTYSGFFEEQANVNVDINSRRQSADFPVNIPGAGRLRWEAWAFIPITGPVFGPANDRLNFEAFNDSTAVRGYTRGDGLPASTRVTCTSLTYEYAPVICNSTSIVDVTGSGAGEFRVLGPERTSALFNDFMSAPFQDWTVALWFADQPNLDRVAPDYSPLSGGGIATLTGTDFTEDICVVFGDNEASEVTVVDSTTIQCRIPPGESGRVDVRVRVLDDLEGRLVGGLQYGPNLDEDVDIFIGPEDLLVLIDEVFAGQIASGDLIVFDLARFWMEKLP
jgi:hypothetical protein